MKHGGFRQIARDLSVCLNPAGPPPGVRAWWQNPGNEWIRYPEPHAARACALLESQLGWEASSLLLGNGCGELFALALRALGIAQAAVVRPCYGGYGESCAWAGVPLRCIDLPERIWGCQEQDAILWSSALQDSVSTLGANFRGALFLANPNNPDGRTLSWNSICQLSHSIPQGYVFLDESYMDFVELPGEGRGLRSPAELPANVLVFASFTKFFCLAGLRLASVRGPLPLMRQLRALQLPWTVNGPAQAIANLLYKDADWLAIARHGWKNALVNIREEWSAYGVTPCEREVPWLFGSLPIGMPSDLFLQRTLQRDIAVRIFPDVPEGMGRHVRIGLPGDLP